MAIAINRLYAADDTTRASVTGIAWALWAGGDITQDPDESGSGLATDAQGAVTVPSSAGGGVLMLRVSDTDMGLYTV